MPRSAYSFSLLRSVRIEIPRMLAAWVRLPRQCLSVSRIRSRSTSATVRPTSARVTVSAATGCLFTARRVVALIEPHAVRRQDSVDADFIARCQEDGAVERVLQCAHVAGPAVEHQ